MGVNESTPRADSARLPAEPSTAPRERFCSWVVARRGGGLLVCSAPAKMAGGRPYCADHFPAVVS